MVNVNYYYSYSKFIEEFCVDLSDAAKRIFINKAKMIIQSIELMEKYKNNIK